MCLKDGEDVWYWMMRKFCQGVGEVSLSRMLMKCNYSHRNLKGFWKNLCKVIVLWMVLKYGIYVNVNEPMFSYWNKILQMYCGIYIYKWMCNLDDLGCERWCFGHLSVIFFYQATEIVDMERNNNLLASFGLYECVLIFVIKNVNSTS